MSIASALFATAAPVSTGTPAAALGADSVDADLFSSKVADVLNAGVDGAPAERMSRGYPAGARSLGVIMTHAMTAEPDTAEPDAITSPPTTENSELPVGEIPHPTESSSDSEGQTTEANKAANDDTASVAAPAPFAATLPAPTVAPAPPSVAEASTAEADGSVAADVDLKAARALGPVTSEAEMSRQATSAIGPEMDGADKAAAIKADDALARPTTSNSPRLPADIKPASDAAAAIQAAGVNADQPAAASPIAQALTAAQIPTAQVQISVVATAPRHPVLAPADVIAALDEAATASEQPAEAGAGETAKPSISPHPAPALRSNLHAALNQNGDPAAPAIENATGKDAASPNAAIEAVAKPTSPSAKAGEAATAAVVTPDSASSDTTTPNPTPGDAQPAQQVAASGHAQDLSTLSRATVETTAQLAAQIARKLEGRSTRFDMVLTPEDLGRVDVSLEIGKDGQLSARLAFDNPAAAADLKGRADELRRQLQDAGFQVAGDALDFSQRDPSTGGGAFGRQQQRNALFAGGSRLAAQADIPTVPAPGAWINHSLTPERVDLKV